MAWPLHGRRITWEPGLAPTADQTLSRPFPEPLQTPSRPPPDPLQFGLLFGSLLARLWIVFAVVFSLAKRTRSLSDEACLRNKGPAVIAACFGNIQCVRDVGST